MTIKQRLALIEKKLSPPEPPSYLFLHGTNTAPLEEYRRTHGGKDPTNVITFRTIAPDGNGGIKYIDEGLT